MKIFSWSDILQSYSSNLSDSFFIAGTGISVGSFDGLHLGHRKLLGTLIEKCQKSGAVPGVLTFTRPLPSLKHSDDYLGDICTLDERLALLESIGIAFVILVDFDDSFASRTGEEFFSILKQVCNLKIICEGVDFKCGYKGATDMNSLIAYGQKEGIETYFEEPVYYETKDGNLRISSSYIRKLIKEGNVILADQLRNLN